mmetsp:Transcript_45059/g.73440  ORF Transcript_45059/g.73440 Transcript_45059/m.73440 type:complete len:1173 (-) Transcript_45059:33-3551(-)
MQDAGDGVGDVLECGGDGDDLLDGSAEPLDVVVPIQNVPHIHLLSESSVLQPPRQEVPLDLLLRGEDSEGDGAGGHGLGLGLLRDDVRAVQALVLDHLRSQELREAPGGGEGEALLGGRVVRQGVGHGPGLEDQVHELVGVQIAALRVQDVQVVVGHLRHRRVALLQRGALRELGEHLRLEHFDQLELPAPLELEPLELRQGLVVIEDGVPLLDGLALLPRRRQDHGQVRPVHLEEDAALGPLHPLLLLGVPVLILGVGELLVHVLVQHDARVRDVVLLLLLVGGRERVVLRERRGEAAPDPIGVQLQGQPDAVRQLPGHLDDVGPEVRDHAAHLHAVPPAALPHHVPVERVQDALVRQLQRLVQHRAALALPQRVLTLALLGLVELPDPLLREALVDVAAVAERPHRVHEEGVLPLADGGVDSDLLRGVGLLVRLPGVLPQPLLHQKDLLIRRQLMEPPGPVRVLLLLLLLPPLKLLLDPVLLAPRPRAAAHAVHDARLVLPPRPLVLLLGAGGRGLAALLLDVALVQGLDLGRQEALVLQLVLDAHELGLVGHEVLAAPHPLHPPLAVVLGAVVHAGRALLLVHHRGRLQAVGEDDVGVHGPHVQMVNQRPLLAVRVVPQVTQLAEDIVPDLLVVGHLLHLEPALHFDRKLEGVVHAVDQRLVHGAVQRELLQMVRPEHPRPNGVHVAPDVRLALEQMVVVELLLLRDLFVGEDDVLLVRLHHQQRLAARARPLPQHLIRRHGDDGAQGEDERVDVLHVQIVRGHGVGDRVRRHVLRPLLRELQHVLGVNLQGVVPKLCLRHRLKTLTALGQVAVSLHPIQTVDVRLLLRQPLPVVALGEPQLLLHVDAVVLGPGVDVRHIEEVAVERHVHVRIAQLHLREPALQHRLLVLLVEHDEGALVLRFGGILEVIDVLCHDVAVDDEVALGVQHVGDHIYGIHLGVRELQRGLATLDIEGADLGHGVDQVLAPRERDVAVLRLHAVPQPDADLEVDGHADVVLDVELLHVDDGVQERQPVQRVHSVRLVEVQGLCLNDLVLGHRLFDDVPQLAQVRHVREQQLEELALLAGQVVGHVQVLLLNGDDVRQQSVECPFKPHFDLPLGVLLRHNVEVRLVPLRHFEGRALLRQHVHVQRRQRVLALLVRHGGGLHLHTPAQALAILKDLHVPSRSRG